MSLKLRKNGLLYYQIVGLCNTYIVHLCPMPRNNRANFVTDFVADCVTDFCIFLSYKTVGKSFSVIYALCLSMAIAKSNIET